MKRNPFSSRKDGTTFSQDMEYYFTSLKKLLNKYGVDVAIPVIASLEAVKEAIKEGSPVDTIIDQILDKIKVGANGKLDEAFYEWFRASLPKAIAILRGIVDQITEPEAAELLSELGIAPEADRESQVFKLGSILAGMKIRELGGDVTRVETDMLIQSQYYSLVQSENV